MARREERAYREYVSDEQRSQAGCLGGQSGTLIRGRVLSSVRGTRRHEGIRVLGSSVLLLPDTIDGTIER